MNFEKIRFVTEIIGIIALVSSLLLLVAELRQTKASIVSSAYQVNASIQNDEAMAMYNSEFLPDIFLKVTKDEVLSGSERFRFIAWLRAYHRIQELTVLQYHEGVLEEWALDQPRESLTRMLQENEIREDWTRRQHRMAPAYREFVNKLF